MRGKRINNVEEFFEYGRENKCVFIERMNFFMPTAFVQNWQAWRLHKLISTGQVYKYIKKGNEHGQEESVNNNIR